MELPIQFKYGYLDLSPYRIGDHVRWPEDFLKWLNKLERPPTDETASKGPNRFRVMGRPGSGQVVVDGCAENCPKCGYDDPDTDYYIIVRYDIITDILPNDGKWNFGDGTFLVIS